MAVVKLPAPTAGFSEEKYQEFLDVLKKRVVHPEAPDTEIPAIKDSRHRQTIFNCLANNWSAGRVHAYLVQTASVNIPISAIQEFRDQLDEGDFLPITYLQRKFREYDIEVDAIGELARLLKLKAERVDMALFIESTTHPLHPIVDQQMHEYWELVKQYLAIQKGLGHFAVDTTTTEQNLLPADIPPGQIPTIRHLIELVDKRPEPIETTAKELL